MNELFDYLLQDCRAIRPDIDSVTFSTNRSDKGTTVDFYAHIQGGDTWGADNPPELLNLLRASLNESKSTTANTRLLQVIGA